MINYIKIYYLSFLSYFFFVVSSTTKIFSNYDEWKQFNNFQERFNKKYNNLQDFKTSFEIFTPFNI
jgi:hypothetical protein